MEESKANITGRLQAVKRNSGKSYGEIANETGLTNVYVAQLLRRQAQLKQETAEKLRHSLPELTEDLIHEMMKPPMRSYDPNLIREPCVYRLKEAVAHFGESIKEIIDEEFGDGIMSAIDFYCSVDKVKGVDGEDRVVVTFDGKYLPYREEVTHVPPEQSQSRPKRAIVTPIVTPTWEQLLGSDDWDGILDPLYLSLRKLILRCGDFAEATYDAFDNDSNSDNRGNSLYPKETLFESVKVKNRADYEIASFLYATSRIPTLDSLVLDHPSERSNPWDPVSNWMGYVAITTDTASNSLGRREIYVVWRGTTRFTEWGSNLTLRPVPITPLLSPRTDRSLLDWFQSGEPKVHRGWLDIYTSKNSSSNYVKKSARDQLWDAIDDLKGRYNKENLSIVVTGHSLGGSLATLSAFDLAVNGFLDNGRVAVFAFSCPKVGNEEFKKKVESYPNLKILHTHIRADLVPNLPGSDYVPIRTAELEVQTMNSPYVQLIPRPIYVHNLEVVLHMVAGWNGANNFFGFKVDRELALVNKWTGFLIDRLNVPDNWWPDRNKPGSKLKYDDKKQQWGII